MKFQTIRKTGRMLARSASLIWRTDRARTLALVLLTPVQGVAPLAASLCVSALVNALAGGGDFRHLIGILGLWALFTLLENVLQPVIMQEQGELSDRLSHEIHMRLFDKSMKIEDLATAENPAYRDDVQVIQDEVAWRPVNLVIFSLSCLRALITVAVILISLAAFHPLIGALLLLSLLPQSIVLYRLQQESFENLVERSPLARSLNYHADIMLGQPYAKELRVFRYGRYIKARYEDVFQTIFRQTRALRKKKTLASALLFAVGTLGCALSFLYVLRQASRGVVSVGSVTLFASYILIASTTLITFMQESALLYDTLLFMEKFFSFCARPLAMKDGEKRLGEVEEIEFRNVSFRYPGAEKHALTDVSFTLRRGERAALVGENGSGKSTVMKLLCRFYDADEGEILVNGRDIRTYQIASLRAQIGIVFQDFASYDLTVKENVFLADVSRMGGEAEVDAALRESGALPFVQRLARGKDQQLGRRFEGGVDLSGGEWQKLSIARAFFRRGSVLLLDEPSSALDARSEDAFWKTVLSLARGKLALMVTHRLASVRFADQILVLEGGRVAERGTHRELMEKGGVYAGLYRLQAERYAEEEPLSTLESK